MIAKSTRLDEIRGNNSTQRNVFKVFEKKKVASSCGVQIIIQLSFSYELKTHPVCKQSGFFYIGRVMVAKQRRYTQPPFPRLNFS